MKKCTGLRKRNEREGRRGDGRGIRREYCVHLIKWRMMTSPTSCRASAKQMTRRLQRVQLSSVLRCRRIGTRIYTFFSVESAFPQPCRIEGLYDDAAGPRADRGTPRGPAAAALAESSELREEPIEKTTIQAAGSPSSAVWQRL